MGAKGAVHALLVGINDYPEAGGRSPLKGCLNDIAAARAWLEEHLDAPLSLRELRDGEATAAAVRDAITGHLGQAGPGDTALFWFSGHGTEFAAVEADHLVKEATGRCQAVVCVDVPLIDKELGALLDGLAACGAHTVAVLDCCFSGGAARESRLTARFMPPDPAWRAPAPGVRGASGPPRPSGHVLLAASRLNELSYEDEIGGRRHGLFTHSLLGALAAAGPTATYREVLAAAHCRVQTITSLQHPVLFPPEASGIADRPVLGGAVHAPSPHLLSLGPGGWEVDCGSAHGLRASGTEDVQDGDGTEFTVAEDDESRIVRARAVRADRTLVTPHGWTPDPQRVYPVALSALALPPTTVEIEAPGEPRGAGWLREAVGSTGPGGGPTPLVRVDGDGSGVPHGPLRLRVRVRGGRAAVMRRDGTCAVPELPLTGPEDAWRVADCLVHLTRWHQLHGLSNPASPLTGLVRLEIAPWGGPAQVPDAGGELVFSYGGGPGDWREPWVSVRIHNRSTTRTLWCVLLDLTDSYASHAALYRGDFIGPGRTGFALDNEPVRLSLPPSRLPRPGVYVRDWLKLIVAEGELNTVPFQFGPWDPDGKGSRLDGRRSDGVWRLAPPGGSRDMGAAWPAAGPGQWAALTVPLRTVVPGVTGRGV